jgi:hypothetical protein
MNKIVKEMNNVEVLARTIKTYEMVQELYRRFESGEGMYQDALIRTLDMLDIYYITVIEFEDCLTVDIFPDPSDKERSFLVAIENDMIISIEKRMFEY